MRVGGDVTSGAIGALLAWRMMVGPQDTWSNVWVPTAGAIVGILIWEYVMRPAINYVWAVPEQEHLDMHEAHETLRAKCEVYTRNIETLSAEVGELRVVLDRSKNNQELADALTKKHEEGVTQLLNRPPRNPGELNQWRDDATRWEEEVVAIMLAHNCSLQELNHVKVLALYAQLPQLHTNPATMREMSMFAERLNRVKNIATKYAGD